jgi:hypothetical protein
MTSADEVQQAQAGSSMMPVRALAGKASAVR